MLFQYNAVELKLLGISVEIHYSRVLANCSFLLTKRAKKKNQGSRTSGASVETIALH